MERRHGHGYTEGECRRRAAELRGIAARRVDPVGRNALQALAAEWDARAKALTRPRMEPELRSDRGAAASAHPT